MKKHHIWSELLHQEVDFIGFRSAFSVFFSFSALSFFFLTWRWGMFSSNFIYINSYSASATRATSGYTIRFKLLPPACFYPESKPPLSPMKRFPTSSRLSPISGGKQPPPSQQNVTDIANAISKKVTAPRFHLNLNSTVILGYFTLGQQSNAG